MRTDQLEQKLAHDPRSPLFARLAEDLLRVRRVDEALHLCLEGLQRFPDYATAHFVAARCFAHKGDFERALQHLERIGRVLPGNEMTSHWMNEWRTRGKNVQEGADRGPATAEAHETEKKALAPEQIVPGSGAAFPQDPETGQTLGDSPIVSITLAEIYSTQGAYEAAIAMYRKLQQQKPRQAAQFETKIQELREKIRQRV